MDCPKCGFSGAKEVMLARFPTYLCINSTCSYFDQEHAYGKPDATEGTDFDWRYRLEDGTYICPDEDGLQICWDDDDL